MTQPIEAYAARATTWMQHVRSLPNLPHPDPTDQPARILYRHSPYKKDSALCFFHVTHIVRGENAERNTGVS
ncbi:hypothetical protein ACI01nite_20300 [Acetobacter cibinongensis]|uniref:Uncharacterized protein n=1 Tax=Acetobacter cibinongensis TaxID=146475 RepID=A0A0D6N1K4_9PROT|nr:hypothetical protein Abci_005_037 [Acetobacter cibinongensis]GBQ12398.1 hypothetical protein AA0482_0238 [Acetobacter cibinongensis NRIC 0482]GEL59428.1 hypothetical protein ACI01nite_20300 [Acetobacter cibinongensis]